MSRYEALRDSDEEQEEDNHEDQQNNHNHMKDYQDNNPEKEDEEIELSIQNKELEISHTIGKNSSNLFTTSINSQTPKYCGGMLVERVDNLLADQPPVPSEMEIQSCLKVLQFIGTNVSLFKLPEFKSIRQALQPIMDSLPRRDGNSDGNRGKKRKLRNSEDDILAEKEKNYINQTQLKALRKERLEKLNEDGCNLRIPDGVALLPSSIPTPQMLLENGDGTSNLQLASSDSTFIYTLRNPLSCYICHKPYIKLHFFYHQLCPDCAVFNFSKRDEMANMTGMVCIVTGGRTKIGYRSALKLLRCGATVIVTTRFPVNAAETYAQESDYLKWMRRLQIFGLDFRDISKLEAFCHFIEQTYDRLDVLINNACQTVRRPPAYYAHLIEKEEMFHALSYPQQPHKTETEYSSNSIPVPSAVPTLLERQRQFSSLYAAHHAALLQRDQEMIANSSSQPLITDDSPSSISDACALSHPSQPLNLSSAQMTQLAFLPEEKSEHLNPSTLQLLFPAGYRDVNNQQIDLRNHNSWTMKLDEVPTVELAEVFAINTIAPTILNARLKPLMKRTKPIPSIMGPMDWKFIVNVSAMEGKFYRYKSSNHPHTNMAKAALNMMTRTSAQDYVKDHIYMTAVDTGWINDEKPIEKAMKHEEKHDFQTPLDEIDAASRVLDPVICPLKELQEILREGSAKEMPSDLEPPWGHFLKDYMKSEW